MWLECVKDWRTLTNNRLRSMALIYADWENKFSVAMSNILEFFGCCDGSIRSPMETIKKSDINEIMKQTHNKQKIWKKSTAQRNVQPIFNSLISLESPFARSWCRHGATEKTAETTTAKSHLFQFRLFTRLRHPIVMIVRLRIVHHILRQSM